MIIKQIKMKDLPKLSESAKERVGNGFWSLYEVDNEHGCSELVLVSEKKIFYLTKKGKIIKIKSNFNRKILSKFVFIDFVFIDFVKQGFFSVL